MTTDSTRSRIQRMLTDLLAGAEAAPTDIAGPCEPPTLAEALTLIALEANFAADYSEAMRIGLEAREHLDHELVVRASAWRFETVEETAASDAAAMVQTFSSVSG